MRGAFCRRVAPRIWRDFGSALPVKTRLTQTKPVLPLPKEHGSQAKDQGRRQCCHTEDKKFPYRPTRDVSTLSGHASYWQLQPHPHSWRNTQPLFLNFLCTCPSFTHQTLPTQDEATETKKWTVFFNRRSIVSKSVVFFYALEIRFNRQKPTAVNLIVLDGLPDQANFLTKETVLSTICITQNTVPFTPWFRKLAGIVISCTY
jgi:hypothetical protein